MSRVPAQPFCKIAKAAALVGLLSCTPAGESRISSGAPQAARSGLGPPQFWQRSCERSESGSYHTLQRLMLTGSRVRLDTGISFDGCRTFVARLVEEGNLELSQDASRTRMDLTSLEAVPLSPLAVQLAQQGGDFVPAARAWAEGQRWTTDQERSLVLMQIALQGSKQLCPEREPDARTQKPETCFWTGPDADLVPFLGRPLGVELPPP